MALYKEIRQNDGVRTTYHRIMFLQQTVNKQNSIAVLSYTDEEARKFEQDDEYRPYRKSVTYEVDYDPTMTVDKAYEYLKTLDVFTGAEDI
jgi:hypothetical protein